MREWPGIIRQAGVVVDEGESERVVSSPFPLPLLPSQMWRGGEVDEGGEEMR